MKEKIIAFGIIVVALVIVGCMVQRSLPGDTVYTIKTELIERSIGFFHFSIQNHTRYEWQNLERRLYEAMMLDPKEVPEEKVYEDLAVLMEQSAERVVQGLKEQSGKDDAEVVDVAVRGMAVLSAYASLLREKGAESEKIIGVIQRAIVNLRKVSEQSIHAIVTGQRGIDAESIGRESLRSATSALQRIDLPKDGLLTAKYSAAEDALRGAEAMLSQKKFGEAFELSNRAKGLAIEMYVLREETKN